MAKSLLLNVLVDVLGNYVEGLSKENLKLGVWSGKIELFNLKLKGSALDKLNLPIQISRGFLKKLKLKIPWTQLESKPVQVTIDGVFLQAGPIDLSMSSSEDLWNTIVAAKLKTLKERDGAILSQMNSAEGLHEKVQKATYVQQLTTKIIDNIEITLTNVHIRYEDSTSIPGSVFSTGITIDSLTLSTTDENWSLAFISREIKGKITSAINKLGVMENFGVYWNTSSESLGRLDYASWEGRMQDLIFKKANETSLTTISQSTQQLSGSGKMNYILSPPNKLSVKIVHREVSSEVDPKVDVVVESSTLPFALDSSQYAQLMATSAAMGELDRKRQMALCRPKLRPTADPRGWWKYAYLLVTGRKPAAHDTLATMSLCLRSKDLYIACVRKATIASELVPCVKGSAQLTAAEEEQVRDLEEKLPLSALVVFRQIALKEAVVEVTRCRADPVYAASKGFSTGPAVKSSTFSFWSSKPKQEKIEALPLSPTETLSATAADPTKSKKTSMFSGWFSKPKPETTHSPVPAVVTVSEMASPSKQKQSVAASQLGSESTADSLEDDEEGDQFLQTLEAKLALDSDENAPVTAFSLRVKVQSRQTMSVTLDSRAVVVASMESKVLLETRLNSVLCSYQLHDMSVTDMCTVNPFNKHLVFMADATEGAQHQPQCSLLFENKPGKNKITLTSSPLAVTWNEQCVQKLMSFLGSSSSAKKPAGDALLSSRMSRFTSQTAMPSSVTEVLVEMYAPQFTVPEDCCRDDGFLLLDAGHLHVHGILDPSQGMQWEVALTAINIGMPTSAAAAKREQQHYLIRPFDVKCRVQNVDKTDADLVMGVEVVPSVTGVLDAAKIARLLRVSQVVVRSLTTSAAKSAPESHLVRIGNNEAVVVDGSAVVAETSSGKKVDFLRNKAVIRLTLPQISVSLELGADHFVEYAYRGIEVNVIQRECDLTAGLNVNSFVLTDSKRPPSFRSILWTPQTDANCDAIIVAYRSVTSRQSPLFNGNQAEVTAAFSKICLSVDEASTLRFEPFVKELALKLDQHRDISLDSSSGKMQHFLVDEEVTVSVGAKSHHLGGQLIVVSLASVELQVLHVVSSQASHVDLLAADRRVDEVEYETAFRFECDDLFAEVALRELKAVKAHINSFRIVDKRKISSNLHYNTLISRNFLADESTEAGHILELTFEQQTTKTSLVEVALRDVTTMVSVDLFLDFARLMASNAAAASTVLNSFSSDAKINRMAQENVLKVKSMIRSSIVQQNAVQASRTSGTAPHREPAEEEETSSLRVAFSLVNPRLLLIEDPAVASSKAIVSHCKLSLQYIREVKDERNNETRESMHASLQQAEVFVLTDMMSADKPHQIIEPTGVDFHLNRMCEKGRVLSNQITLNTDDIASRVSLNDIVLASTILARANLVSSSNDKAREEEELKRMDVAFCETHDTGSEEIDSQQAPMTLTLYTVRVNVAQVNLMLINDFNSENIPIAKLSLDTAEFSASGVPQEMHGEGGVILSVDYYNVAVSSWEPLVEPWHPTLTLLVDFSGTTLELLSEQTVQLNLSGAFCRCLYNANWLMSQIGKEGSYGRRQHVNPLSVRNQLGLPVELLDSQTKRSLATLGDSGLVTIQPNTTARRASTVSSKFAKQLPNHPDLFDLKFGGALGAENMSLVHLPLYVNHPKSYLLQSAQGMAAKKNIFGAPIVEEAYQNQRYYPLKGVWGEPWAQLNDLAPWTDIRGKPIAEISKLAPPVGWEWVEPQWRVDRSGVVGKEIDKDGFEYGTAFTAFGHAKKRRSMQPMDTVRRCKWVRSRVAAQSKEDADAVGRPMTVVWDVVSKSDGTREINIRSGVQVRNELPFPVELDVVDSFSSSSSDTAAAGFVVEEGALFSVPLLQAFFSSLRFRPALGDTYSWSDNLFCKLKTPTQPTPEVHVLSCASRESAQIFMRVSVMQKEKSLIITCSPSAIVYNRLPCNLSFTFVSINGSREVQELVAGGQAKVVQVDLDSHVDAIFTVAPYESTHPFRITNSVEIKEQSVVLAAQPRTGTMDQLELLNITLRTTVTPAGLTEIYLYSQFVLIDRSGEGIMTRTRRTDIKNAKITNAAECIERRSFRQTTGQDLSLHDCWAGGGKGLSLFQTAALNVSLGVADGAGWLHDISLDAVETGKSSVEIPLPNRSDALNLAIKVTPLIGAFSATHVLTVMPCYSVVNCMEEEVQVLQVGGDPSQDVFSVRGGETRSWHKANAKGGTAVFLKSVSSGWSVGTVDLNDIGSTTIVLPRGADSAYGNDLMVLHAEVKLSEACANSYITIVLWRSVVKHLPRRRHPFDASSAALSVRNDTDLPVVVQQSELNKTLFADQALRAKFDLCVPPKEWQSYGWTDPSAPPSLTISVGTSSPLLIGSGTTIDTLRIGVEVALDLSSVGTPGSSGVKMVMRTLGNGKLLHIFNVQQDTAAKKQRAVQAFDQVRTFKCVFASVGLSLVAERPLRREFMSMYIDHLELLVRQTGPTDTDHGTTGLEVKVMDVQLDNYSESVVFPVLLNSFHGSERLKAAKEKKRVARTGADKTSKDDNSSVSEGRDEDLYYLQFAVVKENSVGQTTTVLQYVAFRMLDTKVALDSSTVLLYLCDLHSDLFRNDAGIDATDPNAVLMYIDNFNHDAAAGDAEVDVKQAYKSAQASKMYLESLVIHPIRLKLSFTPSTCPRSNRQLSRIPGYRSLRAIENVASVEDFQIKINSFIVRNAMESPGSLATRIIAKVRREMQSHLVQIAGNLFGSLTLLGKPAGLYKNIGSGVQDFFYEPYMGMMESPTGFVRGIGVGTTSLVTGVASGVISSAATIVGSATGGVNSVARGVVNLTGDDKYVREREEKRREHKAAQGGVVSGFMSGGESIVSGFASGLSGLVTKPYEEGKKSGALGFVRGIGMGIVGAAVKPVIGVTDGISSVAQGFTQQLADVTVISNVRPARAFERSTADVNDLILVTVDLFAAEAQHFILRLAAKKDYKDRFHNCVQLGFERNKPSAEQPFAVAISDVYVFLLSRQCAVLWSVPFGDISHFAFVRNNPNSVELFTYKTSRSASSSSSVGSGFQGTIITCASRSYALKLYSLLFSYVYRMGNPKDVAPVDVAAGASSPRPQESSTAAEGSAEKVSNGTINRYQFGTANSINFPAKTLTSSEIFERVNAECSRLLLPEPADLMNLNIVNEYHKRLDECAWHLISLWKANHSSMWNQSRCAACVVLNNSRHHVQVLGTELHEGQNIMLFSPASGYDKDSRSILPNGGAVLVFAYGYTPSLTDLAHVKLTITTTAFSAQVSTRRNRTDCKNAGSNHSSILEKSLENFWTKCVISIT